MGPGQSAAVADFFREVSRAYQANPWQLTVLITSIVAVVLFLVFYARRQLQREREERARRAASAYEDRARQLNLNPSWEAVISRMALYLKNPVDKYVLLENEAVFSSCAAKLLEHESVSSDTIAGLRVALGFRRMENQHARSTAGIPEHSTIFIRRTQHETPIKGTVLEPQASSFRVSLPEGTRHFVTGSSVEVFYQNNTGIFRVATTVQKMEGTTLYLRHSEYLTHQQKRKYFRRKMKLPVYVCPYDSDEKEELTYSLDLGGGGASLENPHRTFNVGDAVEITFPTDRGDRLRVMSKVVRLSEEGDIMHVTYVSIRESVRDRIYSTIFRPAR